MGDDLRQGLLRPVLSQFVSSDTAIYAVYPHSRHLSPKVRAFVDFMAKRFGPNPSWDDWDQGSGPQATQGAAPQATRPAAD